MNHGVVGKGQQRLHHFQLLLIKGLHSVLHKEFFGFFTQQTRETGKVQGARIAAGESFKKALQKTINSVPFWHA